jgi:16S rRNA processing protein RimM
MPLRSGGSPTSIPHDMLAVGVVTSTHGVAGELKVKSFSGLADHILTLREALFRRGEMEKRLVLESVRPQPPGVIVKVAGLDNPESAHRLVGWEIWVPRAQAARLGAGEFYEADLCRCSLWFNDEEIGPIRSVWDGGPAQLLEVKGKEGRTHLVPFTDHFIGAVELERGRIFLREDEIVR